MEPQLLFAKAAPVAAHRASCDHAAGCMPLPSRATHVDSGTSSAGLVRHGQLGAGLFQKSPAMVNQIREGSIDGELEPTRSDVNIDGASPVVSARQGVRSPTEVGSLRVVDHFKGICPRLRGSMGDELATEDAPPTQSCEEDEMRRAEHGATQICGMSDSEEEQKQQKQ